MTKTNRKRLPLKRFPSGDEPLSTSCFYYAIVFRGCTCNTSSTGVKEPERQSVKGVKSQWKQRFRALTCLKNSRCQVNEPVGKRYVKEDEVGEQHRDPRCLFQSYRVIKGFRESRKYEQRRKYYKHFSTTCLGNFCSVWTLDYVQQAQAFNLLHGVYSPQRPTLLWNKWPPE